MFHFGQKHLLVTLKGPVYSSFHCFSATPKPFYFVKIGEKPRFFWDPAYPSSTASRAVSWSKFFTADVECLRHDNNSETRTFMFAVTPDPVYVMGDLNDVDHNNGTFFAFCFQLKREGGG